MFNEILGVFQNSFLNMSNCHILSDGTALDLHPIGSRIGELEKVYKH